MTIVCPNFGLISFSNNGAIRILCCCCYGNVHLNSPILELKKCFTRCLWLKCINYKYLRQKQKIAFVLRVSVRRQIACYVTERRLSGNTTDKFNSTQRTVNVQYIPQLVHSTNWYTRPAGLIFWTSLVYTSIALCLTFKLVWLKYILVHILKFRKYPYLEKLHHTYIVLGNYVTISNGKQLNVPGYYTMSKRF